MFFFRLIHALHAHPLFTWTKHSLWGLVCHLPTQMSCLFPNFSHLLLGEKPWCSDLHKRLADLSAVTPCIQVKGCTGGFILVTANVWNFHCC